MPRYCKVGVYYDRPGHPIVHGELELAVRRFRPTSANPWENADPEVELESEELFKLVPLDVLDAMRDQDVPVKFQELPDHVAAAIWQEAVEEAVEVAR